MIEVSKLSKYYGEVKAVDEINFSIARGEVVGLLGPNGAGKTTTIRMLCCYLEPTSGVVKVDGINVLDDVLPIKNKIGYLPESAPLYEEMLVYNYLKYIADVREISTWVDVDKRIAEMSITCGLQSVMHKSINELSKGYRQRVGLAHALIGDPEILILDEPTSGLDPNQIIEIRELIKKIGKEKTVILCSHILSEVEATCDRVIIINDGKVVADGTTQTLNKNNLGGGRLILEFSQNVALKEVNALLSSIKKIIRITEEKQDGNKEFHIIFEKDSDIREEVYTCIKKSSMNLISFYKQKDTLENIFRELTH